MSNELTKNDDLVRDVYNRLGKIEAKIDDVREIRNTAERAEDLANKSIEKINHLEQRISKIDKIIWWVSTTIIGTVIVALLGLILTQNQ